MIDKDKLQSLILWGVVSYALAILIYFTLKVFGHTAEFISAFGSILAATAAFFAAYVAIALFNNWRDQHNKTVEKEMAWIAIHNFDVADLHLSQFKDVFQNFKYRCQFLHEMPDDEFQNLNSELNEILNSIRGVSLEFSSFWESIRKYSLIAEKTYFDSITNDIQQINSIIFNLQNHRAHFPGSMNAIESTIGTICDHVINIEKNCINQILKELKALT